MASVIDIPAETAENKNGMTDKPHNDKPITKIEISPNGEYLVTYSKEDHSIVGWKVDVDEGQLFTFKSAKIDVHKYVNQICVSDDKKLVYISDVIGKYSKNYLNLIAVIVINEYLFNLYLIDIIDMNNQGNKIELDLYPYSDYHYRPYYCTFNLKREFILYSEADDDKDYDKKIIWIYSTQSQNKWACKGIYKIPDNFELISISKYDKLYLYSNNYLYEWDIFTEKSIKIFANEKNYRYHHQKKEKKGLRKRHHHKKAENEVTNTKLFFLKLFENIININ
jgi:WD40 repeat protein